MVNDIRNLLISELIMIRLHVALHGVFKVKLVVGFERKRKVDHPVCFCLLIKIFMIFIAIYFIMYLKFRSFSLHRILGDGNFLLGFI